MLADIPSLQVVPPVQDVRELYGLADCFVLASRTEGLPYAIGEAMASELPVITSNLPQVIETFGPAGRGLISFKTGDAEDLVAAMLQVLSMPPEGRRHLGIQNAAYVRDHLSIDRWTDEILAVYRSVLAQRFGPTQQASAPS
jgi:glycosyltransferase involved in cell wall biosynthesis